MTLISSAEPRFTFICYYIDCRLSDFYINKIRVLDGCREPLYIARVVTSTDKRYIALSRKELLYRRNEEIVF